MSCSRFQRLAEEVHKTKRSEKDLQLGGHTNTRICTYATHTSKRTRKHTCSEAVRAKETYYREYKFTCGRSSSGCMLDRDRLRLPLNRLYMQQHLSPYMLSPSHCPRFHLILLAPLSLSLLTHPQSLNLTLTSPRDATIRHPVRGALARPSRVLVEALVTKSCRHIANTRAHARIKCAHIMMLLHTLISHAYTYVARLCS